MKDDDCVVTPSNLGSDVSSRYDRSKRVMDVLVAGTALVASAPLQVFVAIAVLKKFGRPVLFTQDRPGRDGKIFRLKKFRSMLPVDAANGLVSDEQRLTNFGKFLRSTSLDELPTLFNVLQGDMSIVGPRPLLPEYLPRYSAEQSRRHDVRPGITGLAQVRGRNALSWEEKLALDLDYVGGRSMRLDLQIIALTIKSVLQRHGISAAGSATMPEFLGASGSVEHKM